jgi:signal transduction histidine kinase
MNLLLCPDANANFLKFFDISIAPPLLFYAYIPIFLLCVFFGFFILKKDKSSAQGKYFFGITISFATWIFLVLFQWVGAYLETVHLAWQILIFPEISIFIFSILFTYAFLFKTDAPNLYKYFFSLILVIVAFLLPTTLNISAFDLANCEGVVGQLWPIVYVFELVCLAIIMLIAIEKLLQKKDTQERFKTAIFSTGLVFFLGVFWISNYFGELTKTYEINLIGPIGMILFLGIISYVIIKFKTFNVKLFSSQVLIYSLWFLIAALLFIQNVYYIHIVVIFTLALVTFLGFELIKSVRREIQQREKIERLAGDLERANAKLRELDQLKSEFLSFASHQLRSPLTAIDGYASMLLQGDFGEMPEKVKGSVQVIETSSKSLIKIVNEFLDVSRIQQGRMKYDMGDFDVKKLAEEVVAELRPNVEGKGLSLEFSAEQNQKYKAYGDSGKIKQVIGNIIDNSIKYTPKGGVRVYVERKATKILISVKDTGIGIDKEDLPKLFSEFSRAKDAHKTNVSGTGLGLYVAKQMIEAQKGRVWVESEGKGQGSIFFIELPAKS